MDTWGDGLMLLYQQEFVDSKKIIVTHDLGRIDLNVRLISGGLVQNDKIAYVKQDESDPSNKTVVMLEETMSGRIQVLKMDAVAVSPANPPVNRNFGKILAGIPMYTPTMDDFTIGWHTGYGPGHIRLPDINTLPEEVSGNAVWKIYKVSGDENKVKIDLEDPSQFLVQYSMRYLNKIGDGIEICMDREQGIYWMRDISTSAALDRAEFVNLMPHLDEGVLTVRGEITDMANNDRVWCYFRYRENEGQEWIDTDETEKTEKTSIGIIEETVDGVTGASYQTQMVVRDVNGFEFYSSILLVKDALPYYASREAAMADGMVNCWNFQEHVSPGENAVDLIDGSDMTFSGNVTYGSDAIGNETIYKRVFGALGYGEAKVKVRTKPQYTFCIWVSAETDTGDHTILSLGKNILSLAADNGDMQLELNGKIHAWPNVMPFNGFKILFITIDPKMDKTYLHEVKRNDNGVMEANLVVNIHDTIKRKGIYFRAGRGAEGDANHQEYEYIDSGAIRTIGIWEDHVVPDAQKIDIAINFEDGGLLV